MAARSKENLEELETWFPAGTAEGERAILEKVFVYVEELKKILNPKSGSPYLLVGQKGTGKSALLDYVRVIAEGKNIPIVILRPDDFHTTVLDEDASMGDMKGHFLDSLAGAIAQALVEKAIWIPPGDLKTLYNDAVTKEERTPGFANKFLKFLPELAKKATDTDFSALMPSIDEPTRKEVQKAFARRLINDRFYLLIDDTDQVANPERRGHLNRVWALLLAVREICSISGQICATVTLRKEVWERMQKENYLQRDQTDHFHSLIVDLKSSREHVESIVHKRLSEAAGRTGWKGETYSPFFDGVGAKAPHSNDFRTWADLIAVRSRNRPRDAIQLVSSLANAAMAGIVSKDQVGEQIKIDQITFRSVMPGFSKRRAELFAQEVDLELTNAIEILNSFATLHAEDGGFRFTTNAVKEHLSSLPNRFSINLYGKPIHAGVEAEILSLWRFLHQSDVLNVRMSDDRKRDGFTHLSPHDRSNFVSKANWNEMQACLWEVSPAYRDHLLEHQKEIAARTGLPRKQEARDRRKARARGRRLN